MARRRVVLVSGFLVLTMLLAVLASALPWYGLTADGDAFFRTRQDRGEPDRNEPSFAPFDLRIPLLAPPEFVGDFPGHLDQPDRGHIDQVRTSAALTWTLGLIAAVVAAGAMLLCAAGAGPRRSTVIGLTIVAALFLGYGIVLNATAMAPALNEEMEDSYGEAPGVAFITVNGPPQESESGLWENVASGPGLGWWSANAALAALVAAMVLSVRKGIAPDDPDFAWRQHAGHPGGRIAGHSTGTSRDSRPTHGPAYRIGRDRGPATDLPRDGRERS